MKKGEKEEGREHQGEGEQSKRHFSSFLKVGWLVGFKTLGEQRAESREQREGVWVLQQRAGGGVWGLGRKCECGHALKQDDTWKDEFKKRRWSRDWEHSPYSV